MGEALLGLRQRACIFLRAMLSDPGVCPFLAKDGAPRCALRSFCRKIPVSALLLAGVGMLIAFLGTLGCLVPAPGTKGHNKTRQCSQGAKRSELRLGPEIARGLHTVGRSGWGSMPSMASAETNLPVLVEKKMTTHSSILAWRIPGMGEPGGLLSMGSHRIGHD